MVVRGSDAIQIGFDMRLKRFKTTVLSSQAEVLSLTESNSYQPKRCRSKNAMAKQCSETFAGAYMVVGPVCIYRI